jgi:hypothetical protein
MGLGPYFLCLVDVAATLFGGNTSWIITACSVYAKNVQLSMDAIADFVRMNMLVEKVLPLLVERGEGYFNLEDLI